MLKEARVEERCECDLKRVMLVGNVTLWMLDLIL